MSRFRDGFAYKSPYIVVGLFSIYPPHTQQKQYDYEWPIATLNSHLRGTLVRRDCSLPKENVADERTLEQRIFPCKEFSATPMVWMLNAICGALFRQRFIAFIMLLP